MRPKLLLGRVLTKEARDWVEVRVYPAFMAALTRRRCTHVMWGSSALEPGGLMMVDVEEAVVLASRLESVDDVVVVWPADLERFMGGRLAAWAA